MTGKRFLAVAAFVILISVCGCALTPEQQINAVLNEYAAKYPQPEKPSTGEIKSFVETLQMVRHEWAKTMEPYAARIIRTKGCSAAPISETLRKDNDEILRIIDEAWTKEKPDFEVSGSEAVERLCQRMNLSLYSLERIGSQSAGALATLLREPSLGQQAAISLGLMGEKEILLKYFENEKSTDAERINAALGLVVFFHETKLIPFLVDYALQATDFKEFRKSLLQMTASLALSEAPRETIPILLDAIEKGRFARDSLFNFFFLEKHGVDLQKSIRLHLPGKEGKEMMFIYPIEPLPEGKIKEFLNKLKPEEKEKEVLVEVGKKVTYAVFDRIMSLCEQAGVYQIKVDLHDIEFRFRTLGIVQPISFQLAKPVDKPRVHPETLFVGISPASDEKDKEKGIRFVLKPWQYEWAYMEDDGLWFRGIRKVEHPQFQITNEDVRADKGLREFQEFINERYNRFHPTKSFEHLPIVFAPAPDIRMEVLLVMIEEIRVCFCGKDINFLHHTRGCDWEKAIPEYAHKTKEDFEKRVRQKAKAVAVLASLRWLHYHQDSDGRWDMDGFSKNCKKGETCSAGTSISDYDVGISALALLTLLNDQKQRPPDQKPFIKTISRGLDWLLTQQKDDGLFAQEGAEYKLFNHIPAAWSVCRAYKVLGDEKFKIPAEKAVKFLIDSQNPNSGWGKNPNDGNSNTLSTAAAVVALLSAKSAKLDVPESVFKDALKFFDSVTDEKGIVGFEKTGDKPPQSKDGKFVELPSMTAAATACRLLCGVSQDNADVRKGVKITLENLPEWDKPNCTKVDFVYWYFGTMAIDKVRGDNWGKWTNALKEAILNSQRVGGCADGSWDPVDRWSGYLGRVGETALAELACDIYYSYRRAEWEREQERQPKEPAKEEK